MNASFPTPEHVLRTEAMNEGFTKIFIEESGRPFHLFTQPDLGLPHDHPFGLVSHVVAGGYVEEVYTINGPGKWTMEVVERRPGTSHRIEARTIHRVIRLLDSYCLTHVEPGPPEIKWSFYDFRPDGVYSRFHDESQFRPVGWYTS